MDAAQTLTARMLTARDGERAQHGSADVGTGGCGADQRCADQRCAEHAGEPAAVRELTDREREVLAFERQFWQRAGSKERAIRERFALRPARYYQLLNALVDEPAAIRADPVLVQRLRRVRAGRQRVRDAHQPGIECH